MPRLATRPAPTTTAPKPVQPTKAGKAPRLPTEITVRGRASQDDIAVLAVDPGEHHVGVVLGYRDAGPFGWKIDSFAEMKPWDFVCFLNDNLSAFDWVTCEKFTLYPSLAKEQTGSEMPTCELIGTIKNTVRWWNERIVPTAAKRGLEAGEIEYVSYPAAIQKGTAAVMLHKGIEHVTPKTPDHARSAELHFWHMLIRAGLVSGVQLA